ncbi:MAG: tyrosine-type recombinase/integrase [Limisphaerales bacterium]
MSKDGRWRSFAKVSNLIQYVPNGVYYARIKVGGKVIRRTLGTTVFSTARLKLLDFLRDQVQPIQTVEASMTFRAARELLERRVKDDHAIKPASKEYRLLCVGKITATWPELDDRKVDQITPDDCRQWAATLRLSGHYFNNTVSTLRQILDVAGSEHKARGLKQFENPARDIPRVRVKQKHLVLPEPDQFRTLVEEIRVGSGGWGPRTADLVQFLAYSGLRAFSEAAWVTWADIDRNRREIVVRGDPASGTKNGEVRRLPILPDMERLLQSLESATPARSASDRVLPVTECRGALTRACKKIGITRITHHDLRHLFATRCIESGVDIPTVARWLGHKDGGALAMRVYGHLRNQHSQEMAKKVKF